MGATTPVQPGGSSICMTCLSLGGRFQGIASADQSFFPFPFEEHYPNLSCERLIRKTLVMIIYSPPDDHNGDSAIKASSLSGVLRHISRKGGGGKTNSWGGGNERNGRKSA